MFTLYYKPACPFCQRVLELSENLGVDLDLKDVSDDEVFAQELLEKGGKKQVPFLVDAEKEVSMYESNDIIEYIRENRPKNESASSAAKPRMHVSNAVCESCEG
jgi:anaphase-promoting complex subunit 7